MIKYESQGHYYSRRGRWEQAVRSFTQAAAHSKISLEAAKKRLEASQRIATASENRAKATKKDCLVAINKAEMRYEYLLTIRSGCWLRQI